MLKNKIVLVTGTSRGIGEAVAAKFAENGAIVYAVARKEGCLDELCNCEYSGKIIPLYFDVRNSTAAKNGIMRIKKEQGHIDILVNNAGIMKDALIGMIDEPTAREVFDVNVFAVMNLIQITARIMMKQKSGSIINLSSIVGEQGNSGQLVYSATKGAVSAMTKTASKELAPYNIRVNAVAPGMIDTDMFHSIGETQMNERIKLIRMGRVGKPEEVADTCLYLASDLSLYVTGQIIIVGGGQ
jgi:3-oxoacyl-[acyl-carrier protein] reductase